MDLRVSIKILDLFWISRPGEYEIALMCHNEGKVKMRIASLRQQELRSICQLMRRSPAVAGAKLPQV
jgi:hypothetical protein